MAQRKGRERGLNDEEIGRRLNEIDSDDDNALDLEMDGVDDEEEDDLGEQERVLNSRGEVLEVINLRYSVDIGTGMGVPRILPGGMHIFG
jgi:hypothetical protein